MKHNKKSNIINLDDIDNNGNFIEKKLTKKSKEKSKEKKAVKTSDEIPVNNVTDDNKIIESTPKKQLLEQQMKSIDEIVQMGNDMYVVLKDTVKSYEGFVKLDDKKKLDYFREKLNYKEFMEEYPIVTRYMICMGQYSNKAFKRMLDKIRKAVHPPPDKREKGYMEDQWVRRQADYLRYLWESYQKGHYNTAEAAWVWEDSYKKLKGEFDDFRDKYENVSKNIKVEKKILDADNAKDLLERLKTGKQTISEYEQEALLTILREKVVKRKFDNKFKVVMSELLDKRKPTKYSFSSKGKGDENADKKKIVMVETVAEERFDEVPQHLRMDQALADTLPSFGSNM